MSFLNNSVRASEKTWNVSLFEIQLTNIQRQHDDEDGYLSMYVDPDVGGGRWQAAPCLFGACGQELHTVPLINLFNEIFAHQVQK